MSFVIRPFILFMGSNKNMLVHKSNPESIPTPLHSETVNIVDTYMYMVVETNEFAREYRVRKN